MTTSEAYLNAHLAAKDTEITSLRTRLEVSNAKINQQATGITSLVLDSRRHELRLTLLKQANDRIATLSGELRTTHAAHKLAVQKWSDASTQHKMALVRCEFLERETTRLIDKNKSLEKSYQYWEQQAEEARAKHNDYKKQILQHRYSDQTAEIRRLKTRINQLIDRTNMTCEYFKSFVKENI